MLCFITIFVSDSLVEQRGDRRFLVNAGDGFGEYRRNGQDIDLVSFVDYESEFYQLYASQIDSIVQPVDELGAAAGVEILKRVEEPDAPIYEKVLTSSYHPYDAPKSWNHSDR